MTTSLPAKPSLENLKKQAKTLLKQWLAGDSGALQRIRANHPKFANAADEQLRSVKPRLTDCQMVLARESGSDSWARLKVAVESANRELADQFIDIACLCYDDPHYDHRSFHARAYKMLEENPALSEVSVWSAAVAGNTAAVRAFLDKKAELVNRPGGPHDWAPLICACYSRVGPLDNSCSTFDAARILLDRGADPNAYTLKHNDPPGSDRARRFTALTGIFGGGSTGLANQPPHPRWRELAELLLERGADPADEQALWINQEASLEILLRHGLNPETRCTRGEPITLMGRELSRASRGGHADRVSLLLSYRARTDEAFEGKTPWQHAMENGHLEIAKVLEQAGAPASKLSDVERFVSLCVAGDEAGARAMIESAPGLLARVPKDLVRRASQGGRPAAVNLAIDLGFDPDEIDDNTVLQGMAGRGDEAMVRLLVERGASLTLRDPWYDSTAAGWADFFEHIQLRDRLLDEPAICLFDALRYGRLDRVPDILARDKAAIERPFARCLSREPKPEDWHTPLARMVDEGKVDAVRVLLEHGADTNARHPDGRSLLEVAQDHGFEEIAGLLRERR